MGRGESSPGKLGPGRPAGQLAGGHPAARTHPAWGTIPQSSPGTCPLPSLGLRCHHKVTRPHHVCVSRACMWCIQLFAVIACLPCGLVLDVKLDQNGDVALIRRIYLEGTCFTLLPTESTGHDVPWLVCYLFFYGLSKAHILTSAASSVLHACIRGMEVNLCSFASDKQIYIFV